MPETSTPASSNASLQQYSALELAQALLQKLAVTDMNWHKMMANRKARAAELSAAALVYLLKENSEEALPRLEQAVGWLDRSVSAPPCASHGDRHTQGSAPNN